MPETRIRSISIAAPAYNESAGLSQIVQRWVSYLESQPGIERFEIVVCNDGSQDGTGAILDQLAREHPEVRPVHHPVNQGAATALATAIQNTSLDWVLLLDSDGQFPIENLERFQKALSEKKDAVAFIGVRPSKQNSPFARMGSWTSGRLCNFFHGTRYRDFNCALKLVRGDILRSLTLEAKGLNYSTDITSRLIEMGITLQEVEAEHAPRKHGASSMRLRDGFHRLLFVLYLGYRQYLFKNKVLQRKTHGC